MANCASPSEEVRLRTRADRPAGTRAAAGRELDRVAPLAVPDRVLGLAHSESISPARRSPTPRVTGVGVAAGAGVDAAAGGRPPSSSSHAARLRIIALQCGRNRRSWSESQARPAAPRPPGPSNRVLPIGCHRLKRQRRREGVALARAGRRRSARSARRPVGGGRVDPGRLGEPERGILELAGRVGPRAQREAHSARPSARRRAHGAVLAPAEHRPVLEQRLAAARRGLERAAVQREQRVDRLRGRSPPRAPPGAARPARPCPASGCCARTSA